MMSGMRWLVIFSVLGVAACTTAEDAACPPGYRPAVLAEAYFGRAIGGRSDVSDAEWAVFAAAELTSRFPEGMSIADIAGQWRGSDGLIVRKAAKRVSLLLSEPERQRPALHEAAEAYRTRFTQDSVLLTETPVCARF
jgi:hypothetical protein